MKRMLILLLFFIFTVPYLYADVIRMQDGHIYLGKAGDSDAFGFSLETFGENKKINHSDVLMKEKDLSALKMQQVEIVLKDGSVIRGKIQDYDEEIGLLLNIDFGALTLPVQNVRAIWDDSQRNFYKGNIFHIGLMGGYYTTIGSFNKDFGNSFNATIFGEFQIPLLRGLYAGVDASYFFLDYKTNANLHTSHHS